MCCGFGIWGKAYASLHYWGFIILKAPPKAACFTIVFVPPIYDDNVKLMLCLSKGVFCFWFVLLIAYFDYFPDNQTEKFGRNGNSLEM